ncbi:1140_t:CDS:2 [Gigaspora rosea]|nr:1140_t:CDS:2 [Gigaspora rosea]
MIYEDNGSGENDFTKSRDNLDNACIAWLRKVEVLRNRISEIKQTEGLLEKKNNKIKEDIEKERYEALEKSKLMMSLGDEVDQEELMNDDEKRIDKDLPELDDKKS